MSSQIVNGIDNQIAYTDWRKRRTFAIISHPDAGKTTLTEKLLYFGGAIRMAGQVKARGERRRTQSDWMDIERKRGISISSSVMTFEYNGCIFNLLDTPGHEDFSEDTYRTLTAVDSAIMVIDAAKGIESQTRKLFEVCRLRDIPIITFINKIDRETRHPFELIDEIENSLALDVCPMTWPVGTGGNFYGCFDIRRHRFLTSSTGRGTSYNQDINCISYNDRVIGETVPDVVLDPFREEIELATEECPQLDIDSYRNGSLTPVFFGSALKDYAVEEMLQLLKQIAPAPQPQKCEDRLITPDEEKVSGFIFKVQANMDPNHRDRVAFFRICSGQFRRGAKLRQVQTGKTVPVHNPIFFFAHERALAEKALPGDIIGIPNHGTLRVGDTLTEGEDINFAGIPDFAPEILRRVKPGDPMRTKQLRRALLDMAEEGVIQVFRPLIGAQWILGVVGDLQLQVLEARIETEYKLSIEFEAAPYVTARWITGDETEKFIEDHRSAVAHDRDERPVFMARNNWDMDRVQKDWPALAFHRTKERK